jgi:hypothetical protein
MRSICFDQAIIRADQVQLRRFQEKELKFDAADPALRMVYRLT